MEAVKINTVLAPISGHTWRKNICSLIRSALLTETSRNMCTIPKKKLHKTEISAILFKVVEIHRLKKHFLKRRHYWACFKDNFVLIGF